MAVRLSTWLCLQVAVAGSHQHAFAQIDTGHVGANQRGIAQRGATQIGAFQPCAGHVRASQIGAEQVGPAQVSCPQIGMPQPDAAEIGFHQAAAGQIQAGRIDELQACTPPTGAAVEECLVPIEDTPELEFRDPSGLRSARLRH
jgi:hypothetical protein